MTTVKFVKGDRIRYLGYDATVKYMQGDQVRFRWDGANYDRSAPAADVAPLELCDYCPSTGFVGSVCPTCGYDYSNVTD